MDKLLIPIMRGVEPKDLDGGGVFSEATWQNPDTIFALRNLFGLKADEIIEGVVATKRGIKIKIKTVKI